MAKAATKRSLALLAPLPASDQDIAHRKEIELVEQQATRKEICKRIGQIRKKAHKVGKELVAICNDVIGVGNLIIKDWESLPGKEMTLDFWQKHETKYRDQYGVPITRENLKWCVRMATLNPKPITEVQHAKTYERGIFSLIGFELQGEAPGSVMAPPMNYFTQLTNSIPRIGRELELCIESLKKNPNFGPVQQWPIERVQVTLQTIGDTAQRITGFYDELKLRQAELSAVPLIPQ